MAIVTQTEQLIYRRTKIIATVGPASSDIDMITSLIDAGVNVFRLNMSHGEHESHEAVFRTIRDVSEQLNQSVGILADLCGPKIRTGKFKNDGIELVTGSEVTITTRDVLGQPDLIPSQYASLASDVEVSDRILMADGLIELQVLSKSSGEVICKVIHGGSLSNQAGINLPGVKVSAPSMTQKDIIDARFVLGLGVDFIALSFVRRREDLAPLRQLIDDTENNPQIISKIEKPEALTNVASILEVTDAIMVARGDLGVELPPEEVPFAQSELIRFARQAGKPVIVATQMLESMIEHSRPTRAEVTDVSHAVNSAVDAIMLSGETAMGRFPVQAVSTMDRIARQTEAHLWQKGSYGYEQEERQLPLPIWNVIANATAQMSSELMVRAVMVISKKGVSAATVSVARPAAPIVGITNDQAIYRRMALLWGVIPLIETNAGKINPNQLSRDLAASLSLVDESGFILLVRGFDSDPALNSPSVTVIPVG